ncbi:hypothetical protein C1J03_13370 [Sulfitobacter sp. SK012]|nr:hypothetical protein C1J03_13370 [Sulfitobacter sp. SK012]
MVAGVTEWRLGPALAKVRLRKSIVKRLRAAKLAYICSMIMGPKIMGQQTPRIVKWVEFGALRVKTWRCTGRIGKAFDTPDREGISGDFE